MSESCPKLRFCPWKDMPCDRGTVALQLLKNSKKHCSAILFRLTDRQGGSCDCGCCHRHDSRQEGAFFPRWLIYVFITLLIPVFTTVLIFTSRPFRHCVMLLTRTYKCSAIAEVSDRLATIDMGRKVGCCVPFTGSWVSRLTQCRLDRGLPLYQVAS